MTNLLNPYVDIVKARRQYRDFNWTKLEGLFDKTQAEKVLLELVKTTQFINVFDINGELLEMSEAELTSLSSEQRDQLFSSIQATASKGTGQFYAKAKIDFDTSSRTNPECWSVKQWLNSEDMLEMVADVSGKANLSYATCEPLRLSKGQFLTKQVQDQRITEQKIVFLIDLIPDWKNNWGGLLQLHDVYDGCGVTFTPEFNSMVLFDANFRFSITQLASFIKFNRYSILGHFYID